MPKAKVWPQVKLAHYMVKRDGEVCHCHEEQVDPRAVCRTCWGTGFVGGYTLHAGSVSYYLRDTREYSVADGIEDAWITNQNQYQAVDPVDLTQYAIGDFLLDLNTGQRWGVVGFDAGVVRTRLIQPYEPRALIPVT